MAATCRLRHNSVCQGCHYFCTLRFFRLVTRRCGLSPLRSFSTASCLLGSLNPSWMLIILGGWLTKRLLLQIVSRHPDKSNESAVLQQGHLRLPPVRRRNKLGLSESVCCCSWWSWCRGAMSWLRALEAAGGDARRRSASGSGWFASILAKYSR